MYFRAADKKESMHELNILVLSLAIINFDSINTPRMCLSWYRVIFNKHPDIAKLPKPILKLPAKFCQKTWRWRAGMMPGATGQKMSQVGTNLGSSYKLIYPNQFRSTVYFSTLLSLCYWRYTAVYGGKVGPWNRTPEGC